MMSNPGFKITGKSGFHITFENHYTVSVQFNWGYYCDGYDDPQVIDKMISGDGRTECPNAEVAVWGRDGNLIAMPEFDGDTVGQYYTPEMVFDLLQWAKVQK